MKQRPKFARILNICLIHITMGNVIGCKFSVWMVDSNPRIPELRGRARPAILPATSAGNSITRWKDAHGPQCSLNLSNGELYIARGFDSFVRGRSRFRRRSGRARVRRECIIIKSRSRSAARKRTEWRAKKEEFSPGVNRSAHYIRIKWFYRS